MIHEGVHFAVSLLCGFIYNFFVLKDMRTSFTLGGKGGGGGEGDIQP